MYDGDLVALAASLGHFGGAENAEAALEMAPATNLQSSAGARRVQGGCKEGARRCKEGATRVRGGCREVAGRVQGGCEYRSKGNLKS